MLTGLKARLMGALATMGAGILPGRFDPQHRTVHPADVRKIHNAPLPWTVRIWRSANGQPFFGPVGVPTGEFAWVSRQTTRHRLRALMFQSASQRNPLMPRRDRRRLARVLACLEYRSMMVDQTNSGPVDERALQGAA